VAADRKIIIKRLKKYRISHGIMVFLFENTSSLWELLFLSNLKYGKLTLLPRSSLKKAPTQQ